MLLAAAAKPAFRCCWLGRNGGASRMVAVVKEILK